MEEVVTAAVRYECPYRKQSGCMGESISYCSQSDMSARIESSRGVWVRISVISGVRYEYLYRKQSGVYG